MKASITIKNPVIADVYEDTVTGGALIDLFDDSQPGAVDVQVHLSIDWSNDTQTGNSVTDFVTQLLEKAGIKHYEYNLVTEVRPVAAWETEHDRGSTDDPFGYLPFGDLSLDYVSY